VGGATCPPLIWKIREVDVTRAEEIGLKRERVRDFLRRNSLYGIYLTRQENFSWYTAGGENFVALISERGVAPILVTLDGDYIVTNNIESPRINEEEVGDLGFETKTYMWYDPDGEKGIIESFKGKGVVVTDNGEWGERLKVERYSLLDAEVERYRRLGRGTAESMDEVCRSIRPGQTEYQVAGALAESLLSRSITPVVMLVAADERISKFRHPLPRDNRIRRYAMVVVCARRWGLIVSMTRIVHFGRVPEELRKKHSAVVKVDAAFIANTVPGRKVRDIFKAALETYAETGFGDEWKLHHQGGGTGYSTRDFKGSLSSDEIVRENQAYAWNPSITGTKSEDTIIAAGGRAEIISEIEGWPSIEVSLGDTVLRRPDILRL